VSHGRNLRKRKRNSLTLTGSSGNEKVRAGMNAAAGRGKQMACSLPSDWLPQHSRYQTQSMGVAWHHSFREFMNLDI